MMTTMMRTMTTVTTTESAPPRGGPTIGRLPSLSVRTRLVGSVAVLSALGFIGAGAAALFVERQRIESRVEQSLAREIGEFTELASSGQDPRTGQRFADAESLVTLSMERNIPDQHETHLAFLAALTIVPVDGTGSLHLDPDFRAQVTEAVVPGYGSYQSADQGRVAYAVMPFTKDGQRSHFITAYFVDREFDELAETIWLYAVAATFAWAGLVMAAWLLARRILQPIEELRSTAATITETDVSRRIAVTGADEVADLGRTVNGMLDRLEDALDSQRRMLDDAGHELKTPITVIRGHLELMDEDDASDVRATRRPVHRRARPDGPPRRGPPRARQGAATRLPAPPGRRRGRRRAQHLRQGAGAGPPSLGARPDDPGSGARRLGPPHPGAAPAREQRGGGDRRG